MNLARETDFGTPASSLEETVTIEIDGLPATVKKGSTIMRAARESGVDVPKLCATDNLEPFGSCRLCLVEIGGRCWSLLQVTLSHLHQGGRSEGGMGALRRFACGG